MLEADRGYNPANVLTARLPLPAFAYPPERRAELLAGVVQRLRDLPGVRQAAFTDMLPLTTGSENLSAFTAPSRSGPAGATVSISAVRPVVSEDYFAALGMRILDGRGFTERDTEGSAAVMVVNRTFARRYLGDAPVGTRLPNPVGDGREREVVGVVEDVRQQNSHGSCAADVLRSVPAVSERSAILSADSGRANRRRSAGDDRADQDVRQGARSGACI